MVKKSIKFGDNSLQYSFDAGNGGIRGISSESRGVIEFAPIVAPLTKKKAVNREEANPHFSLRVDNEILVFGMEDVFAHGQRDLIRRRSGGDRYQKEDYTRFLDVLYLKCFDGHRGNSDPIAPTGVISLPVVQYQKDVVTNELREELIGEHKLEDHRQNCALRLVIDEKRLTLIPESYGAMMHYAFDPDTLKPRPNAAISGSSLVIDIGYDTTDVSLFEGTRYQRDQSFTIEDAGMGVIVRAIVDYIALTKRHADVTRVDFGLRAIAGVKPKTVKKVEFAPDEFIDVTDIYDTLLANLVSKIADGIETRFRGSVVRALLCGGGAYHTERHLADMMGAAHIFKVQDPDHANTLGGLTVVRLKAAAGR